MFHPCHGTHQQFRQNCFDIKDINQSQYIDMLREEQLPCLLQQCVTSQ